MVMRNLQDIIRLFNRVNSDCQSTGESVVPLTKSNIDYYTDQMTNLNFDYLEIELFVNWLKTQ